MRQRSNKDLQNHLYLKTIILMLDIKFHSDVIAEKGLLSKYKLIENLFITPR
jgi:hypothetical protein